MRFNALRACLVDTAGRSVVVAVVVVVVVVVAAFLHPPVFFIWGGGNTKHVVFFPIKIGYDPNFRSFKTLVEYYLCTCNT